MRLGFFHRFSPQSWCVVLLVHILLFAILEYFSFIVSFQNCRKIKTTRTHPHQPIWIVFASYLVFKKKKTTTAQAQPRHICMIVQFPELWDRGKMHCYLFIVYTDGHLFVLSFKSFSLSRDASLSLSLSISFSRDVLDTVHSMQRQFATKQQKIGAHSWNHVWLARSHCSLATNKAESSLSRKVHCYCYWRQCEHRKNDKWKCISM